MFLQACFDDRSSDPSSEAYVLAGWISSTAKWEAFSSAWSAALAKDGLAYFKMSEAMKLTGEFQRGWNASLRDKKVFELAEIIRDHAAVRVGVGLNRPLYDNTVGVATAPSSLHQDPYFLCFYECAQLVSRYVHKLGADVECDLIFDLHGKFGADAASKWDQSLAVFEKGEQAWKVSRPMFRDDKKFRPLQAADMFAWCGRARGLYGGESEFPIVQPVFKLWEDMPAVTKILDREYLIGLAASVVVSLFAA